MAEVKKVDKTAEGTGFQNVAPDTVVDTTIRQAAATVPGSEAAAKAAMPSDEAVAASLATHPASKSFRDVQIARHEARLRGEPENNEAYPAPVRDVKPSKRTEAEMSRGKAAQGDAAHVNPGNVVLDPGRHDPVAHQIAEYDRNKAAEQQVERVLGVEDAPKELKARPSEPPGVDTTESGGFKEEKPHAGDKTTARK